MVTEHLEMETEGQMELSNDDEEDLCKVWDMAMDKVHWWIITIYLLFFDMRMKIEIFLKCSNYAFVLSRNATFITNESQVLTNCLQDVAGFLQKFKATEILVGVISKSRCPRLTVS